MLVLSKTNIRNIGFAGCLLCFSLGVGFSDSIKSVLGLNNSDGIVLLDPERKVLLIETLTSECAFAYDGNCKRWTDRKRDIDTVSLNDTRFFKVGSEIGIYDGEKGSQRRIVTKIDTMVVGDIIEGGYTLDGSLKKVKHQDVH